MLTFYDNDFSTCAQKVRVLLHEKGEEWKTEWLDLRAGDQHKPDYLKLNPNGVVPTIVDDGDVVIESSVIIQYLDETRSQSPSFTPTDAIERTRMRRWMQRIDSELHVAIAVLSVGLVFRNELMAKQKTPEALEAHLAKIPNPKFAEIWRVSIEHGIKNPAFEGALKSWMQALYDMEAALGEHDFVCGASCSLADISLLPYVMRLDHLGVMEPLRSDLPRVFKWYQSMRERPSCVAALDNTVDEKKISYVQECGQKEAATLAPMMDRIKSALTKPAGS